MRDGHSSFRKSKIHKGRIHRTIGILGSYESRPVAKAIGRFHVIVSFPLNCNQGHRWKRRQQILWMSLISLLENCSFYKVKQWRDYAIKILRIDVSFGTTWTRCVTLCSSPGIEKAEQKVNKYQLRLARLIVVNNSLLVLIYMWTPVASMPLVSLCGRKWPQVCHS